MFGGGGLRAARQGGECQLGSVMVGFGTEVGRRQSLEGVRRREVQRGGRSQHEVLV